MNFPASPHHPAIPSHRRAAHTSPPIAPPRLPRRSPRAALHLRQVPVVPARHEGVAQARVPARLYADGVVERAPSVRVFVVGGGKFRRARVCHLRCAGLVEGQRVVPEVVDDESLARQALGKVLYHQRHNVVIRLARRVQHPVFQRCKAQKAQHLVPL